MRERILRLRSDKKFSKALLMISVATTFVLICAVDNARAHSQSEPQNHQTHALAPLSFDAASIVERDGHSPEDVIVGIKLSPGRLVDQCANLQALVSFAFNLPPLFQAQGLPNWASGGACGLGNHANTYEVEATMPPNTTTDQARQMMQTLLAERFKLATHWEARNMSVFALVVGKDGFKLKPTDPNAPPTYATDTGPCPQDDPHCHILPLSPGPISVLASFLGRFLGRPVIDQSGVSGKYDISLRWAGDNADDPSLPSLPTALREKFGLELKSETAPINLLVIDHVEKPSPN